MNDCLIVVGWCGGPIHSSLDAERSYQRGGGQKGAFRAIHTSLRQTDRRER